MFDFFLTMEFETSHFHDPNPISIPLVAYSPINQVIQALNRLRII
jgi:hypothetical protein